MQEHDIQNAIRIAISENKLGVSFRTNVGQAWTGEQVIKNSDGSITILNPRPFSTGLEKGFSDLLVVQPIIISVADVGHRIARACFIEVKTQTGRASSDQKNFISQMQNLGAKAGIARSVEDAIHILRG